jgi:hypothetical protein
MGVMGVRSGRLLMMATKRREHSMRRPLAAAGFS